MNAEPARQLFVHDHRASDKADAGTRQDQSDGRAEQRRGGNQQQTVCRVLAARPGEGAVDRARHQLHLAPEHQGNDLADDDRQAPGREDGVERPRIERPHDNALDEHADQRADQQREHEPEQRRQADA